MSAKRHLQRKQLLRKTLMANDVEQINEVLPSTTSYFGVESREVEAINALHRFILKWIVVHLGSPNCEMERNNKKSKYRF